MSRNEKKILRQLLTKGGVNLNMLSMILEDQIETYIEITTDNRKMMKRLSEYQQECEEEGFWTDERTLEQFHLLKLALD